VSAVEKQKEGRKTPKSTTQNTMPDCFLVYYPTEKLRAIQKYSIKKGVDLEENVATLMDALYKKLVPKEVREYIEESEDFKAKEP